MSTASSRILVSKLNGDTLRITERDDDASVVSIIGETGLIKASILVSTEELRPKTVSFEEFDFPVTPGSVFSAYDPEDRRRYEFETYANANDDAIYKMDGGEFFVQHELQDYVDFIEERA